MQSCSRFIKSRLRLFFVTATCLLLAMMLVSCAHPGSSGTRESSDAVPAESSSFSELSYDVPLPGSTALYIGNSFTQGVGSASGQMGLYERTKDLFESSREYVSMGAGFVDYEGQSGDENYVDLLQRAIDDPMVDTSSITHLFIIGARGDCWARGSYADDAGWLSDMRKSTVKMDALIQDNFPNLEYCGYVWADAFGNVDTSLGSDDVTRTRIMHEMLPTLLDDTSITYMGWIGWSIIGNQANFSSDGYHPNDDGYMKLAHAFKSAFSGSQSGFHGVKSGA